MKIKGFVFFSCFLIPLFVLQCLQAQNMTSSSGDTVTKEEQTPTTNLLIFDKSQEPIKQYDSPYLDKITKEEQTTIANLSLDELLVLIKKYDSLKVTPIVHIDYALGVIFRNDNWLTAVDPLLEIYSSSPGGAKEEIVESLSCLCTTREMPPQFIDKIQDTFLADLGKGTAINKSLRARLVRGLYKSVLRPWITDSQKDALRKKGIDPDAPLRGTDKVLPALIKALDDENAFVRMEAVGGLQVIEDTSIEDTSILPALEARKQIEQDRFVNHALDRAIDKLQKKSAALAGKKENN
jgi:hypothetical protein